MQKLDAYIQLTPRKKQELSANIDLTTGSQYFLGSSVSLGYRHFNLNRAANELHITLNGGLEVIRNEENKFEMQAQEYGINADLVFPRFILPFRVRQNNRSTSKTRLSAGFQQPAPYR